MSSYRNNENYFKLILISPLVIWPNIAISLLYKLVRREESMSSQIYKIQVGLYVCVVTIMHD